MAGMATNKPQPRDDLLVAGWSLRLAGQGRSWWLRPKKYLCWLMVLFLCLTCSRTYMVY